MNSFSKSGFIARAYRLQILDRLLSRPEGCTREEFMAEAGAVTCEGDWFQFLCSFTRIEGAALRRMEERGRWQLIRSDDVL